MLGDEEDDVLSPVDLPPEELGRGQDCGNTSISALKPGKVTSGFLFERHHLCNQHLLCLPSNLPFLSMCSDVALPT